MIESKLTRRTFLKSSAATAALACGGSFAMSTWHAQQAHGQEANAQVSTAPSLCNGCSSKCGLEAQTKDGRLWTLKGSKTHPYSKGKICGRGHGFAQLAYSGERVTQPLKRNSVGEFEPISWDDAYKEIATKVKEVKDKYGPGAIAGIHDPRPSGKYYTDRFIKALGSPNIYTHGASCNLSKESGFTVALGEGNYSVDFTNTKMVVFIGRSYGDGIRPSSVASLSAAYERGARIVMVDPRLNNSCSMATDWLPITPGTDLALLLAIANVLIEEGLYNKKFVEEHSIGFEAFAEQAKQYTPTWAEEICDISAEHIQELARALAKAAPAAAIEPSWRAAFGCSYANSFETARGVAAVNTLLGSWNAKGGALIVGTPKFGAVDKVTFPSTPKPTLKRVGDAKYPLALESMGTNLAVVEAANEETMKACFFYNSNAAKGYAQPKAWQKALESMDLVVSIEVQMSETALLSHYVLPECTYLERLEVPELLGGKQSFVALRTQVLDVIHPETKPCDQIYSELASACGAGDYFNFRIEELCAAQLKTIDVSFEELLTTGTMELPGPEFVYGEVEFATPSGKFEFSSEKVAAAGLNPVIGYVARAVEPKGDEMHFIGGKQGIHSHTMTMNTEALNTISRTYNLERVWMNATDAAKKDIHENDMIEISSSEHTGTVAVHVTERIKPGVVYIPTHYGGSSPYLTRAYQYGLCMTDFVPFHTEPAVGSTMSQEVAIKVKKVTA